MPASSLGRDAGEQVVKRQHRVRLAAAEIGLELHDRVAALAGEAPHGAYQHPLQALGEIGAAEELDRVPVFVSPFAEVHLPEIGGELGLLVAAAGHVLVRRHNLAPGLEVAAPALSMAVPALLRFSLRTCSSKRSRRSSIFIFSISSACGAETAVSSRARIQRAVGVVAGEWLLVRPAVPIATDFTDEAALSRAKGLPEHIVPGVPHELQQQRRIPLCDRLVTNDRVLGHGLHSRDGLAVLHGVLDFTLNERR